MANPNIGPQNEGIKMSHHQQDEQEVRNDPAFDILALNPSDKSIVIEVTIPAGGTALVAQRGIIGALANQLKNTSNKRKGSSILRKLGYVLADCGNFLYGGNIAETDLDQSLIIDTEPQEYNQ